MEMCIGVISVAIERAFTTGCISTMRPLYIISGVFTLHNSCCICLALGLCNQFYIGIKLLETCHSINKLFLEIVIAKKQKRIECMTGTEGVLDS